VIETYHRPATLEQALSLLETEGTAVLGGGTSLVAAGGHSAVLDLQDLGLDSIAPDADRLAIGAMVRLRDIAESDLVPLMLRELALREAPNTIRNAATIGGTVATADPEGELVAGMLVYEAAVTITGAGGETTIGLDDYLATRPRGIITGISVATGGEAAADRTGRTPADRPIIMAVARRASGGILLALTGVASTPLLIDPADVDDLVPPADFRGSTEYRAHLATVLAARAIAGVEA
jgi:probable selenate reductase FAD-binding subunit